VERDHPFPLFLSGEAHLECCVQFWVFPYKKEMKMIEGLEHLRRA